MRRLSAFSAACLLASASAVAVPSEGRAATASPPGPATTAGTLVTSISAPSTGHAGSTYSFSVTLRQTSSYTMLADGAIVGIWLPSNLNGFVNTRNPLLWRNPATGAWQSPYSVENSTGNYIFDLTDLSSWIRVAPHGSVTYDFRLSLASSVASGTIHLYPRVLSYELDDSAGVPVNAILDAPVAMTTFTVGGGSSSSGNQNKPSSGTAHAPTATSHPAAPTTGAHPSPTAATSAPAASPSSVVSPSDSTSGSVTPSPDATLLDAVPSAAARSHSMATTLWTVTLVVVLGLLASFVVLRRRARGVAKAGDTDKDHEQ